jgi:hypothetical protein
MCAMAQIRVRPLGKRRTSGNAVWAKFGAWLRLRQFKAPCAVLVQQGAEREAIHHGFAVLHRCEAFDFVRKAGAKLQAGRVCAL